MRRKTGYKILLAAMMALAIANVYVGKALDVHANDPLSRAECAASGSDATVEEYCLICHFHLAACTEAESFLPTLVTLFEERLYRCYLAGGSSPVLHGYGLRAPPPRSDIPTPDVRIRPRTTDPAIGIRTFLIHQIHRMKSYILLLGLRSAALRHMQTPLPKRRPKPS